MTNTKKKTPIRHKVKQYVRSDGTKVKSHLKGKGSKKPTPRISMFKPKLVKKDWRDEVSEILFEKGYRVIDQEKLENAIDQDEEMSGYAVDFDNHDREEIAEQIAEKIADSDRLQCIVNNKEF